MIRTRILAATTAAVLAWTGAFAAAPDTRAAALSPSDRHAKISRVVTVLFERHHYSKTAVDDELSAKMLDAYIEAMDGNRQYFLASDVAEFQRYRTRLDDSVKRGDLSAVFAMYDRYLQRTRERISYARELLETEPDFTLDEVYRFDRTDLEWPETTAELDEVWRQRVKNDALSLVLTGKDWPETREVLDERYDRVLKRIEQVKSDDVFEAFMNAYAHSLDPHSSYFSPRNADEYQIQMSLSYDGIGASLQLQEDFVTVLDVIPGGPAAVDGQLRPKDRIMAVAQGADGDFVDVVGWRLDDVVQLIRGPGGTEVRLQILPGGASPGSPMEVLSLKRDKVKLEAQAAQKSIIEVQRDGRPVKVGVIAIPSFYQDYSARAAGDESYTSTTRDVRRLVEELKEEDIEALVIDLRDNGGGHLSEATGLTGLFIGDGPVVQVRDSTGRLEVLDESAPKPVWDGPMGVLVNRFSASASEIFAAAIQDYGRGVVIGQQTYGKGTVQNLYPLDRYAHGADPRFGQLTLTIGKYYRVTGGSTQHRGVEPDIALPSSVDTSVVGESARPTALPWDQIRATEFSPRGYLGGAIDYLSATHEQRTVLDPDLAYLRQDVAEQERQREHKSVSLNLEIRQQEREDLDARKLALENARREARGLEPLASLEDVAEDEIPDVQLNEAAEVVVDLMSPEAEALARIAPPPAS